MIEDVAIGIVLAAAFIGAVIVMWTMLGMSLSVLTFIHDATFNNRRPPQAYEPATGWRRETMWALLMAAVVGSGILLLIIYGN